MSVNLIMKIILPLILFSMVILASCEDDQDRNTKRDTIEYFEQNLKPEMNYSTIVTFFGKPSRDMGSGIHIYVYSLSDSTEIWIGYTDEILYARHIDKNQQVLDILI